LDDQKGKITQEARIAHHPNIALSSPSRNQNAQRMHKLARHPLFADSFAYAALHAKKLRFL
jgi:hypothetical protein